MCSSDLKDNFWTENKDSVATTIKPYFGHFERNVRQSPPIVLSQSKTKSGSVGYQQIVFHGIDTYYDIPKETKKGSKIVNELTRHGNNELNREALKELNTEVKEVNTPDLNNINEPNLPFNDIDASNQDYSEVSESNQDYYEVSSLNQD